MRVKKTLTNDPNNKLYIICKNVSNCIIFCSTWFLDKCDANYLHDHEQYQVLTAANSSAQTGTDRTIAFQGTGSLTLLVSALVTVSLRYLSSLGEMYG